MTLYETMFKRRSVRSYDKTPLSESTLNEVKAYLATIPQLSGTNVRLEVVPGDKVKDKLAAHYIVAYCKKNFAEYINVGYTLQQADLYLQSIGLGSLWLGMTGTVGGNEDYAIMMAFGKTDVPMRNGEEDFKRLPLSEMSNQNTHIAHAARVAPSAVNSQPWNIHFEQNEVTVNYFGRGVLKAILKRSKSKIDLGIVTKHIETALLNEGKTITSITPVGDDKHFLVEIRYN